MSAHSTGAAELPGPALLFCPADRPDRYAKAFERADGVILDLEDGVAEPEKAAARAALRAAASTIDPRRTIVRVNAADSEHRDADARTVATLDVAAVMVPKVRGPADVADLAPWPVVALIENAAGAVAAAEIARTGNCVALMWGGEDLIADLGGRSSRAPDGGYRDVVSHVRSTALLAARAADRAAIDGIWLSITDLDGLAEEADDAAASGFHAKALIHPSHVGPVRRAFTPTADELAWARRVLSAAAGSAGAFQLDGAMVDAPLLAHARTIVTRAERSR